MPIPRLKISILFVFTLVILIDISAQDCIEYPDIDGTPCHNCVPDGWDISIETPGIADPDGYWGDTFCDLVVDGESPGGGNMAFVQGYPSVFEAISTTVFDLDPCKSYSFGLYWHYSLSCEGALVFEPADLVVTINGSDYTFSGSEEWELVEMCIDAGVESVEIIISGATTSLLGSVILFDAAHCEDLTACEEPFIEMLEDEVELCAGEEYSITASYENDNVNTNYEWTSDDPNGLNYLSDLDIIAPVFTFPFDENYDGGTFFFTLIVDDNGCLRTIDLTISVMPNEVPEFDFVLCEFSTQEDFPSESLNGYAGTWSGDFDIENFGGTTQEFTFLIDSEQDNCLVNYTFDIPIDYELALNFNLEKIYCLSDNTDYKLPDETLNDIEGEWDGDTFNPTDLGLGIFTFTFMPNEEFCALPYELNIEILDKTKVTFNVNDTICKQSLDIKLDSISLEGFHGQWWPREINLDTLNVDSIKLVWIPHSQVANSCLDTICQTIFVLDPKMPQFDLPSVICNSANVYFLPQFDRNGLEGFWNIPMFIPDTIKESYIELNFTVIDEECYNTFSTTIDIGDFLIPVFEIATELCSSDVEITLPLLSDNDILGTWTIPIIDPSTIIGTITSTFIPEPNDSLCLSKVDVVFSVSNLIVPEFNLPLAFCDNGPTFTFPNISINNIAGFWNEEELDPTQYSGNEISNTFIPFDLSCNKSIDISIPILTFEMVQYVSFDPKSCSSLDGIIDFGFNSNFEYSIDGGLTWQSGLFNNLSSGIYDVVVRSTINTDCTEIIRVVLSAFSTPLLTILEATGISDCGKSDGMVVCYAEGSDLEYSIDGVIWQIENSFDKLAAGYYTIMIRSNGDSNCITQEDFQIADIEIVKIDDVILVDISDCGINDGELIVLPQGSDLEYRLGEVGNWQSSNQFINLNAGEHKLYLRIIESPNCIDSMSITIDELLGPEIVIVNLTNPSDCQKDNGTIEIIATGQNLEYSIDNGSTWLIDNVYVGLSSGSYSIGVREISSPMCRDNEIVILTSPNIPQIIDFNIRPPSDCISGDGFVELEISSENVELSIDNGLTWQRMNTFENLEEMEYTIIVRNIDAIDCLTSLDFQIESPPCPCNPLIVEINTQEDNCSHQPIGSIEITDVGGFFTNEIYNIEWSNGSPDLMQENLSSGWYAYTINYDKNCMHVDSIFIEFGDPITFELLANDPHCKENGTIEVININGGSGQYIYSLDGINFQNEPVFNNLPPAEYEVSIIDNNNCIVEESIALIQNFDLEFVIPIIQPINFGEKVNLHPIITGVTVDSFIWYPGDYIDDPNLLSIAVSPEQTTTYNLTIFFGDCSKTQMITIEVVENANIYVSNIFSPNEIENNIIFIQSSSESSMTIVEFSIFDKWGNRVFSKLNPEINNEADGWNGFYKNKMAELGVYAYLIKYQDTSGLKLLGGSLMLIR